MSLFGWQMRFHFIFPAECEIRRWLIKASENSSIERHARDSQAKQSETTPGRIKCQDAFCYSAKVTLAEWVQFILMSKECRFPPQVLSVRTSTLEQFVCVGKYLCNAERTKGDRLSEEEDEFSLDKFSAHWSSVWVGEKYRLVFWLLKLSRTTQKIYDLSRN